MARAITAVDTAPGIATYVLGQNEAFTVLALTVSIIPTAAGQELDFAWLDMRDPTGGIIYLSPLTPTEGDAMLYSLAAGAEPWSTMQTPDFWWPQESPNNGAAYVTQRLALIPLTPRCVLRVYKTAPNHIQPPDDPLDNIADEWQVQDLHLWVQDASGAPALPPNAAPLLTHIAA